MAKLSEQSLGWALLTSACLGLAVLTTVTQPRSATPSTPQPTRTSLPSLTQPSISTSTSKQASAPNRSGTRPHAAIAKLATINPNGQPIPKQNPSTQPQPATLTTVPTLPSTTTTTTTTTTQPVVEMASRSPHGVGYVAQPLAGLASYDVTAALGGEFTLHNESNAPLLVTVDHEKASSLAAGIAFTIKLSSGLHQLEIAATTTSAQSYAIDGTEVSW